MLALACCFVLATTLMVWLGYRATRQWEQSTLSAAATREKEVLALLAVALERDMKGGQVVVLLPFNQRTLDTTSVYALADHFAGGFARYPYIESFFIWRETGRNDGATYFFNRFDRPPPWEAVRPPGDPYPVVILRDPAPARVLVATARQQSADGADFAVFHSSRAGVEYQTIVHFLYDSASTSRLFGVIGFTVNLPWVRKNYFDGIIRQIQRIGGDQQTRIEIADENGRVIFGAGPASAAPGQDRLFPLLFADRALIPYFTSAPGNLQVPRWSTRVTVANDATLVAVSRGVNRTLALFVLAGIVTLAAGAFAVKAARAAASLVSLQSEFTSSMTHEMKTPLALMRLAGDSLASGRYTSPAAIRKYGQLVATESEQLTRLIDNVLSYARISDPKRAYSFEAVDLLDVIEDLVSRLRPQLTKLRFDVQLQLPLHVPPVRADRVLLLQLIGNVMDNALTHGQSGRVLIVSVHATDGWAHIEVTDRGDGIPPDEVEHVFDKFYRGRGAKQRGTGLGLAIARRIAEEHGGSITIRSAVGQGTTVDVALPVMSAAGQGKVATI